MHFFIQYSLWDLFFFFLFFPAAVPFAARIVGESLRNASPGDLCPRDAIRARGFLIGGWEEDDPRAEIGI
jgi:hypothetical protein